MGVFWKASYSVGNLLGPASVKEGSTADSISGAF